MTKRLVTALLLSLVTLGVNAQWTAKDSLNLKRILDGDGELHLNMEAVKKINFGKVTGTPGLSTEKNWMLPDESLPSVLPQKKKIVLTLRPYTAQTRFDWDPIYQKKIKVDENTWRGDPLYAMKMQFKYTNWAKDPMSGGGGYRRSLEEIEASGIRHVLMGERANGMMVNKTQMLPETGIALAKGVMMSGGTISGLNLMLVFEKKFWSVKANERRARTLEVLKSYGDSTTIQLPEPIVR